MDKELLLFILMVGSFMISCFALKLPSGMGMVIAAVVGALAGGFGVPVKQLVEGSMSMLDTVLVIAAAMVFMKCIQNSGALDDINSAIIRKFHRFPALLLLCLMVVVMFPGMITGSSTAAIISAGVLVCPILIEMGIPKAKAGAFIALGGMFGATAPPVNMAVMAIGSGIDIPYSGFELPLILLSFPLAFVTAIFLGYRDAKKSDLAAMAQKYEVARQNEEHPRSLWISLIPLIVMVVLMVLPNIFPQQVPSVGMTVIFLISAIVSLFTGKRRVNVLQTTREAIDSSLPVMGILMGVGAFIEVMTLTGLKGYVVVSCLSLPDTLLYVAILVTIPLFGAISSLGSASLLGVPFVLALISSDQIIVTAAIASLASIGELVPPTALAGIFGAEVAGVDRYSKVLRKCLIPALLIIVVSMLFIIFANPIASILG
ncbi:MAG TPA: TRAP transporter large permease subunit [Candidatus Pullichristensenella stercorigallinarum]|uniref:TRAP transporter large permease subunit n=1 Tax=Candidatus Pullichristensenella stercorigallinarum TaxID=2840909 RepID=A0A9D0ZL89_9FIRM|nr:TRAP transporter large permease subunit [Candidatus Pullichristensenella stercorigallinarum]